MGKEVLPKPLHGYSGFGSTSFPIPLQLAGAWDTTLVHAIGRAIARVSVAMARPIAWTSVVSHTSSIGRRLGYYARPCYRACHRYGDPGAWGGYDPGPCALSAPGPPLGEGGRDVWGRSLPGGAEWRGDGKRSAGQQGRS